MSLFVGKQGIAMGTKIKNRGLETIITGIFGETPTLESLLERAGLMEDVIESVLSRYSKEIEDGLILCLKEMCLEFRDGDELWRILNSVYGLTDDRLTKTAISKELAITIYRVRSADERTIRKLRSHYSQEDFLEKTYNLVASFAEIAPLSPSNENVLNMPFEKLRHKNLLSSRIIHSLCRCQLFTLNDLVEYIGENGRFPEIRGLGRKTEETLLQLLKDQGFDCSLYIKDEEKIDADKGTTVTLKESSPPSYTYGPWSDDEKNKMMDGFIQGRSIVELSEWLNRHPREIASELVSLNMISYPLHYSPDNVPLHVLEARRKYHRAYEFWSSNEIRRLKEGFNQGRSIEELATEFERTPNAIFARLVMLGLAEDPSGKYKRDSRSNFSELESEMTQYEVCSKCNTTIKVGDLFWSIIIAHSKLLDDDDVDPVTDDQVVFIYCQKCGLLLDLYNLPEPIYMERK